MHEILLTAAQSFLAVVLVAGLKLNIKGALLLFGLFIAQFLSPYFERPLSELLPGMLNPGELHFAFSFLYLFVSAFMLVIRRKEMMRLWEGLKIDNGDASVPAPASSNR